MLVKLTDHMTYRLGINQKKPRSGEQDWHKLKIMKRERIRSKSPPSGAGKHHN
jgi:hypothetical protein